MRRHDLQARGMEAVLDSLVQATEDGLAISGHLGREEQFVAHVKIFEAGLIGHLIHTD